MGRASYGLTETTAGIITNVLYDYQRHPDSIGFVSCTHDVKVMNEDFTKEMPRGQIGELCWRGPQIIKSYWNNPEATKKTIIDGWLRSGDLGLQNDEGFIFVRDRAKDMLIRLVLLYFVRGCAWGGVADFPARAAIRGGENIYSVEVEDALYSHNAVMEAAIIGLPDRILGEEVGAIVQLKPGATATPQELINHCKTKIAPFKVPIYVQIRDEPLPKNPNGKIMKSVLKEEVIPVWEKVKAEKAKL